METVEEVDELHGEYDPAGDWRERSFLIEVKPRCDQAALFVDLPQPTLIEKKRGRMSYLKMSKNKITYGDPDEEDWKMEGITPPAVSPHPDVRYSRTLSGMSFIITPMNSPTWTDGSARLFTCKLKVSLGERPLQNKQLHRITKDMTTSWPIDAYVKQCEGRKMHLYCSQCCKDLLFNSDIKVGTLPSDDWMNLSPAVDYFCRDTCGPCCDPERHNKHSGAAKVETLHEEFLASENRLMISPSTVVIHEKSLAEDLVNYKEEGSSTIVTCHDCNSQLGNSVKGYKGLCSLHHGSTWIGYGDDQANRDCLFIDRYPDVDMFFTHMVLNISEENSSVKILVRDLHKKPHMLLWLMDSYVVLAIGELFKEDCSLGEMHSPPPIHPRPVIKLLYKELDENTAANDPRANGEDASVGIIELPYPSVEGLQLALRKSTRSMPPACRTVGLFYVGYLPISNCFTDETDHAN